MMYQKGDFDFDLAYNPRPGRPIRPRKKNSTLCWWNYE